MKAFAVVYLTQLSAAANGAVNLQQYLDPRNISFKNKSTW
jgi:hypothetical protein